MKYPKGHGFDLHGGLIVTAVLDDDVAVTGRLLGGVDRHHNHDYNQPLQVELEGENEFILLQLTEPYFVTGIANFPVGSIVAVNVAEILFIGPGGDPDCDSGMS